MLILTVTYTRPSTDVPFFVASDVFPGWHDLLASYKQNGKLLSNETKLDGQAVDQIGNGGNATQIEIVTQWRSVADNEEFLAEADVETVRDARLAHCTEHNIAVVYTRQVVVDQYDTVAPTA